MNKNNKLPHRIREVMKEQNIPIGELAKKLGVREDGLGRKLKGNMTLKSLVQIGEVLKKDLPELVVKGSWKYLYDENGNLKAIVKNED